MNILVSPKSLESSNEGFLILIYNMHELDAYYTLQLLTAGFH